MLRILTQTFIKIRGEFFRKIQFTFNLISSSSPLHVSNFPRNQNGEKDKKNFEKSWQDERKSSHSLPPPLSLSLSFANYSAIEHGRLSSRAILSVVVGLKFAWCGVTSCHRWIFMGAVRGRSLYRPIRCARVRMELSRSCAKRK